MERSDVIVIGAGAGGLSAAITAAMNGQRVTLIEKNRDAGGSTALAVGNYAAAGTRFQAKHGIADSAEQFISDLRAINGELEEHENTALRDVLARESARSLEWLHGLGVQFFGPTEQPTFTVKRMHQVVPNSRAYIAALESEARRRGVRIRFNTKAERLLRDDNGSVIGVRAGSDYIAEKGVILGTGDYSASSDLKKRFVSEQTAKLPAVNPTATGDGFAMAMAAGAATKNMWRVLEDLRFPPRGMDLPRSLPHKGLATVFMRWGVERFPRLILPWVARWALINWISPTRNLLVEGGILINSRGERFANELDAPARSVGDQPGNVCYMLFDSAVGDKFRASPNPISTFPGIAYAYLGDYHRLRPDVTHIASTLDELAEQLKVEPGLLRATVDRYNAACASGTDADFARPSLGSGIKRAPFIAFGPLVGRVVLTNGGLAINDRCQVLTESGAVIPGLYAVGSTGQGGLILTGHGMHIAWAVTSGRIAGSAIAGRDFA